MKLLIYGKGWISQLFQQLCIAHEVVLGNRIENYDEVHREIVQHQPDRVICMVGRTHGPGSTTIDYLEQKGKLDDNIRDNLYAPILLARVCEKLDIHMTYLGTGCIFTYSGDKNIFMEGDIPNFTGSSYSTVKGYTDRMMKMFPVLNLRIRMPISSQHHPRNFITKITTYDKICSIKNSMSVLDDLLPVMLDMIVHKVVGTINFTNPGRISHDEILTMYREIVDPTFTWKNFTIQEQAEILKADRSNNELDTRYLQLLYPNIRHIHDAVKICLERMKDL